MLAPNRQRGGANRHAGPKRHALTPKSQTLARQPQTVAPDPASSGGQYIIVSEGCMVHQGVHLPRLSVLFVTQDEPALRVVAGAEGLDLLVLQLPKWKPWPRTD